MISIWGEHFAREQIPDVPLSRCKQVVAENNVLTFENGQYYRFKGRDGKEYTLREDFTLDVPYGIDIYNMEYPPRKDQK